MRLADILFSCGVHVAVLAVAFALPSHEVGPSQQVYEVSLAEFAPPAPAAQPEPAPVPPRQPEPVALEPPVRTQKPVAQAITKPKVQAISPRKKEQATAPPQQAAQDVPATAEADPVQPPVATATGSTSPMPSGAIARRSVQVGGMQAYEAEVVDERPSVVRGVRPEYPDKARRRNIEGRVLVRVLIDTRGQPRDCAVQSAEPAGLFEDAAVSAACRHRFLPGRIDGRSVMTVVILPFSFVLR